MTALDFQIRPAAADDVPAINRIYNVYIATSHVSFDTEPWTDDERSQWFQERSAHGYAVLVAERGGVVIGASWSGPWRSKAAYATSVETTIVLAECAIGSGVGSLLYKELIDDLAAKGMHRCYAIVALPNEASIALHHRLAFKDVGVLDEVGRKNGRFVSTLLLELRLVPGE